MVTASLRAPIPFLLKFTVFIVCRTCLADSLQKPASYCTQPTQNLKL
jgi:hypothetical protein